MSKKNQRRRKNNLNSATSLIMGGGLILIGLAAFFMLRPTKNTIGSDPVSRSVIPAELNYPAPELSLENVNGQTESLIDYRDKVTLVNNWAIWCPPCKAEIPTLEAYYKKHTTDGFVIIGIEAGEPQTDVLKFVGEHGMTYPIWIDLKGAAGSAFQSPGLPSSYVIDRKGNIRFAWVGEINQEMLEKSVTPLLRED